ncbi:MAG: ATP-binding protein [Negativicutes bacterium]|nr:ATP-binding protein [Negativicutes bacterium]
MFQWSIRSRLIISYLVLVLITLSLLGGYFLWYFYRHNLQSLTADLLVQADIVEELVAGRLSSPRDQAGIDPIIKDLARKISSRITIIDTTGRVLADSWEDPVLMDNHSERPEIRAALAGGTGSSVRFSATISQNLLYVAIPMRIGGEALGVVRVSTTLAHVEQGYKEIRSGLLAAFLLACLLAVFVSVRLARKYTAPLEEITAAAQQIAEGKLDRRVHVNTGDELEVLAHTLNHLASSLDDKVNEIVAEKSKLELILQHTDSPVMLLDRYGQVVNVNTAAADTFSLTPAMIGLHNIQVIGNSLFDTAIRETIAQRAKRMIDLKTDIKGNKRAFQLFLAPIISNEGEITSVLAVFHDITALKELQERQAEFIANASHELATPLTAIKGFAETLLDGAIKDPDLGTRFVEIIQTEADRMHRLVRDLLQMTKLDSSEYRKGIRIEPTPVAPLIAAAVDEYAAHWREKELAVTVDAPPESLSALVNPDWLKQVILNLLDNAIKYTPVSGKILLKWRQEEDMVVFTVKDSGSGIPSEDLPRIFDRFYRVDRARTRSAGGTGLGLAIVKFIVELLGGKIEAKSDLGVGTSIIFRLPLAK